MAQRFVLPIQSVFDGVGRPMSGARLYFYRSGTSTPLDTYSDPNLTTPNTNPVVADSAGRFDDIFLRNALYKVVLTDADGVTIWTADPVSSSPLAEIVNVKDFGAIGDGATDDTDAIQAAFDRAAAFGGGIVFFPPGIYRITESLLLPGLSAYGDNSILGGAITVRGSGPIASQIFFDSDSGFAIDSADFDSNGPRSFIEISDLSIYGKDFSAASGAIRTRNARMPLFKRLHIHSFPEGDGIQIYGDGTGGSWYATVDQCLFGWWHLSGDDAAPVLGVDDKWWLNRGVVLIGNEDGSGKANECQVVNSAFWNCKTAHIDMTGFDTDGVEGVPDPGQNGVLGGGIHHVVESTTFYARQARRIDEGTAQAGGSSSITLRAEASDVDDAYNGLIVTITGGTGVGQYATITDYDGSTKVASIAGSWDTQPDSSSTYVVGYRCDGIRFDQKGPLNVIGCYFEDITQPIHLTATADDLIHLFGLRIVNSNSNYVVSDARVPFGANQTRTAQGGGASTITLASAETGLSDYYNGRIISIIGGTGVGQRRKIVDYDGDTKIATVANAWDTQPDNSSTYAIVGGPWPSSIIGGQTRGLHDMRPNGLRFAAEWYMPRVVLQRNPDSIFEHTTWDSLWRNGTGGALTRGDVACQGTQGSKLLVAISGANQDRPKVVAGGFSNTSYANGEDAPVARSGSEAWVMCDAAEVNEGDTLVTSATAKQATPDNTETDPKKILGYALTAKAAGSTGLVLAEIR